MKTDIDKTMSQACADTLSRLYREARSGKAVPAAKIAAVWTVATEIPNDFEAIGPVTPASRRMRGRLLALLVTVFIALDRMRLDSGLHVEPTHSRVTRWAESEEKRIRRDRLAKDTEGFEDMDVLRSDFEAFAASGCEDFEAGQLIADSHGYQVLDEDRLGKLEAQAVRAHTMATVDDLLDDGCALDSAGRIKHKGMDFTDAVRAEIGPWTYEFETEDGEVVTLGYEGTVSTLEDLPEQVDELDSAWFDEQEDHSRIMNGYLAGERRERGDRFAEEFIRASECSADRLVKEYKAAWTRYRARHLKIGQALPAAPKGHGLWGHVWLSKQQWAVVEAVYAARTRRTKVDHWGRPNIARERLNKEDVLKWAELAYSLL